MPADCPNNESELDELLSRPSERVIDALARLPGDVLVLGASGKMGPSLARMVKRGSDAAGTRRRVIGAARFISGSEAELQAHGIQTVCCDLLDDNEVQRLPDAENVIFMAGRKFGSTGDEALTWAMNAWLPTIVCQRYRQSRIVALSTGNVYGLVNVESGGSRESDALQPVGEYAMSCLARERLIEHFSRRHSTPCAILRLNYACDLRYGVLVDLAQRILRGEPVDLSMGHFNTIWQGDANAMAICALSHASAPPWIINVTGTETLSVRCVCRRLGELFGKPVQFRESESPTALLSDASLAVETLGPLQVSAEQLTEWVVRWAARGGRTLAKPTHFESRSGRF